jgi:hypothetical protein
MIDRQYFAAVRKHKRRGEDRGRYCAQTGTVQLSYENSWVGGAVLLDAAAFKG